jgi:hypothetical protein
MTRWAVIACGSALGLNAGCDTDAVGIEECRRIEQARCEAAPPCRDGDFDVDDCKRFYRDHCLHGVLLEDAPSEPDVRRCVEGIRAAGSCAATLGPETPAGSCEPPLMAPDAVTACGAIDEPELMASCAFLVPADPSLPGAGGSLGSGGSGGTAGSGGAAGAPSAAGSAGAGG